MADGSGARPYFWPPVHQQQAYADTTFKTDWKVDLGNEIVSARYYGPGHTSGDSVIFFERANIVHGGDLLFRRVHPLHGKRTPDANAVGVALVTVPDSSQKKKR